MSYSNNSVSIYGTNMYHNNDAMRQVLMDFVDVRIEGRAFFKIQLKLAELKCDAVYYWFRSNADYSTDTNCCECDNERDLDVFAHQFRELLELVRKVLEDHKLADSLLPEHDHDHVDDDDDCTCPSCTGDEDELDEDGDPVEKEEAEYPTAYFEELEVVRKQLKQLIALSEQGWSFDYTL